ncbi:MAG: HTH domain-containing protein, partial [Clostridiaceae bacterium]
MKAEGEKMDAEGRRKEILKLLTGSDLPIKGQEIAERFDVTRQVVVKDLAILKAKNPGIVSTYGGYLMLKEKDSYKRIFRVKHDSDGIYEELRIILKYGGIVEDIIIDH